MVEHRDDLDINTGNTQQQQTSGPALRRTGAPARQHNVDIDKQVQAFQEVLKQQQQALKDQFEEAGENANSQVKETGKKWQAFIEEEKQLAETYKSLLHTFGDDLYLPEGGTALETLQNISNKFYIDVPEGHKIGEAVRFTSKYTIPDHLPPQFDVTPDSITSVGDEFGPLEAKEMVRLAALDASMVKKGIVLEHCTPYQATLITRAVEAHNKANPDRKITIKHGEAKRLHRDSQAKKDWKALEDGKLGDLVPVPPPEAEEEPAALKRGDQENPPTNASAESEIPTATDVVARGEDSNNGENQDITQEDRDALVKHKLIMDPDSEPRIIESELEYLGVEGRRAALAEMNERENSARVIVRDLLNQRDEPFSSSEVNAHLADLTNPEKRALYIRAHERIAQERSAQNNTAQQNQNGDVFDYIKPGQKEELVAYLDVMGEDLGEIIGAKQTQHYLDQMDAQKAATIKFIKRTDSISQDEAENELSQIMEKFPNNARRLLASAESINQKFAAQKTDTARNNAPTMDTTDTASASDGAESTTASKASDVTATSDEEPPKVSQKDIDKLRIHYKTLYPTSREEKINSTIDSYTHEQLAIKVSNMYKRNDYASTCIKTVLTNDGDNNISAWHIQDAFNKLPTEQKTHLLKNPDKLNKKVVNSDITSLHDLFDNASDDENGNSSRTKEAEPNSTNQQQRAPVIKNV